MLHYIIKHIREREREREGSEERKKEIQQKNNI